MIRSSYPTFIALALGLFILLLSVPTTTATAEGSKELTTPGASNQHRPFLEYTTDSQIGIPRKTIIKVYANSGEKIHFGSSALANAINAGNGAIVVYDPTGTKIIDFDGNGPGPNQWEGVIRNRTEEVNGPKLNGAATGYNPLTHTATVTGVYYVHFESPNPSNLGSSRNPTPYATNVNWSITGGGTNIQPTNNGHVAAWDVTVTKEVASNDVIQEGRVWTNYLAVNVGANSKSLHGTLYVHTFDDYTYEVKLNGMDPFGFIFFSNNKGFKNNGYDANLAIGDPLYKSIELSGSNPGWTLPSGVSLHLPSSLDQGDDVTHKLFFNYPDTPALPTSASSPDGTIWVRGTLPSTTAPTTVSISFRGTENTPQKGGVASTVSGYETEFGGLFYVEMDKAMKYKIYIDLTGNNQYEDPKDLVISGETGGAGPTYEDSVYWDGKYGDGTIVPAGTYNWTYIIYPAVGEVHFPFIDVEQHPNGFIIERQTPPGTPPPLSRLFWNDADVSVTGSEVAPSPKTALTGKNSLSGAHEFDNNYGDGVGIDSWAYLLGAHKSGNIPTVYLRENDLRIALYGFYNMTNSNRDQTSGLNAPRVGDEVKAVFTVILDDPTKSDVLNPERIITHINGDLSGFTLDPLQVNWKAYTDFYTDFNLLTNSEINSPIAMGNTAVVPNHPTTLVAGDSLHYVITGIIDFVGALDMEGKTFRPPDFNDPDDPAGTAPTNSNNFVGLQFITNVPVELTTFNARKLHDGVQLTWKTATETNNYGFEIERARLDNGNIDNANWEPIGFVDGHGTVNSPRQYSYYDGNASQAGNFLAYRLKQIDRDGQYEYSSIVEVTYGQSEGFNLVPLYPNPITSGSGATRTTVSYKVSQPSEVLVSVYDAVGNEVARLQESYLESGQYTSYFDASDLMPGSYYVVVRAGSQQNVQKLSVVR